MCRAHACRLIWVVILLVCIAQHKTDIKNRTLKHCNAQHNTDIKSLGLMISSPEWWFQPQLKVSFSLRSWLHPGLRVPDVYIPSHLLPPLHQSIYFLCPSHRIAPRLFAVSHGVHHRPAPIWLRLVMSWPSTPHPPSLTMRVATTLSSSAPCVRATPISGTPASSSAWLVPTPRPAACL